MNDTCFQIIFDYLQRYNATSAWLVTETSCGFIECVTVTESEPTCAHYYAVNKGVKPFYLVFLDKEKKSVKLKWINDDDVILILLSLDDAFYDRAIRDFLPSKPVQPVLSESKGALRVGSFFEIVFDYLSRFHCRTLHLNTVRTSGGDVDYIHITKDENEFEFCYPVNLGAELYYVAFLTADEIAVDFYNYIYSDVVRILTEVGENIHGSFFQVPLDEIDSTPSKA